MVEKTVEITKRDEAAAPVPATREASRYLSPAVDIYEEPDALVVLADLPGVDKETLTVRVDDDILTLSGRVRTHPETRDAVYHEFELLDFFRQFELTDEVDQEKIGAELKNGVLTIHLPKAEKARPRQIAVQVA